MPPASTDGRYSSRTWTRPYRAPIRWPAPRGAVSICGAWQASKAPVPGEVERQRVRDTEVETLARCGEGWQLAGRLATAAVRCQRGIWPIDNRPQLAKLPHKSPRCLAYTLMNRLGVHFCVARRAAACELTSRPDSPILNTFAAWFPSKTSRAPPGYPTPPFPGRFGTVPW